jgi:hypothetical protein
MNGYILKKPRIKTTCSNNPLTKLKSDLSDHYFKQESAEQGFPATSFHRLPKKLPSFNP